MIIVEERLKELFDTLPPVESGGSDYQVRFGFGSESDLGQFLKSLNERQGETKYPLIWLITPVQVEGKEDRVTFPLNLIVATDSNNSDTNLVRLEKTVKKVLTPVYENMLKALHRSGFTRILNEDQNKRGLYFNYSERISDIWDALKFECLLEMTSCKMKSINY